MREDIFLIEAVLGLLKENDLIRPQKSRARESTAECSGGRTFPLPPHGVVDRES
jgi:hypothetical protein